jgi:hypothetical protein
MPVQILSRPYSTITPKLLPVYNGAAFVLDSNLKSRPNFRYIAEIFVDNQKVSELRHHPDISHDNKGVFEVGRILENFISYDIEVQSIAGTYNGEKTNRTFSVDFGEEYSGANPISKMSPIGSNVRVYTTDTAAFATWQAGSYIFIEGCNVNSLNGWAKIESTASSSALVSGLTWPSGVAPDFSNTFYYQGYSSSGLATAWSYTTINGVLHPVLHLKNGNLTGTAGIDRVKLYVGSNVIVKQTGTGAPKIASYESVEWKVLSKSLTSVGGVYGVKIVFSAPYGGVMPNGIVGSVISRDNIVIKKQTTTSGDSAYVFNGALQYQEYLDWNPISWIPGHTSRKFLSTRPDSQKNINVCANEHWVLSTFGRKQMSTADANSTYLQVETWSTTLPHIGTGPLTTATIPGISGTLFWRILVPTASVGSKYKEGDYVSITSPLNGTQTVQVAYKLASGPNTYIYINYTGALIPENGTIERKIAVIYHLEALKDTNTILPCGPANFKLNGAYPEFIDLSCYKYFVRSVRNNLPGIYTPWNWNRYPVSETWTFNISCDCVSKTKYKLMWLNPMGGWDFYTFDLASNKSLVIEKSNYQKKLKEVKSNNVYRYNQGDRGTTAYDTKSRLNYIVRSNFLTQEKIEWLSWIYESPEVYWIDETNNKLHPINLTSTDVDVPNKQNAGEAGHLYIYTIEFKTAYDRTIQKGGDVLYTATSNTFGQWVETYPSAWY